MENKLEIVPWNLTPFEMRFTLDIQTRPVARWLEATFFGELVPKNTFIRVEAIYSNRKPEGRKQNLQEMLQTWFAALVEN